MDPQVKSGGEEFSTCRKVGAVSNNFNQICLKTIGDYIKDINPDLIITHSPTDYHPDHRYISEYITNFCSFNFPLIYSENLMGINFYPDYYVDISSYFESKKKAILNHKSQNPILLCIGDQ